MPNNKQVSIYEMLECLLEKHTTSTRYKLRVQLLHSPTHMSEIEFTVGGVSELTELGEAFKKLAKEHEYRIRQRDEILGEVQKLFPEISAVKHEQIYQILRSHKIELSSKGLIEKASVVWIEYDGKKTLIPNDPSTVGSVLFLLTGWDLRKDK